MRIGTAIKLSVLLSVLGGCGGSSSSSAKTIKTMTKAQRATKGYTGYFSREQLQAAFPQTPQEITQRVSDTRALLQAATSEISAISPAERTFDNTVRAYDRAAAALQIAMAPLQVLGLVSPDDALREAAHEAEVALEACSIDFFDTCEMYRAFREYEQQGADLSQMTAEGRYYLEQALDQFEHIGLNLPAEKLAKVNEIKKKISALSVSFGRAIASDDKKIEVSREGLAGLADDFIAQLVQTPGGTYVLGTDYPTYFTVMDYCDVAATRRELFYAFNNRAYPENHMVLDELMVLRDQMARLLGFESFAAYDLADQMVQTPKRAIEFVDDVWQRIDGVAREEMAKFSASLPSGITLVDGKCEPWDWRYICAQYKKTQFNLDERLVAEYFPLASTITQLFSIYEQFLGLQFIISPLHGLWDRDLQLIEVSRRHDGERIGFIILDLYPRPNKYNHACMAPIARALDYHDARTGERVSIPASAIVIANFPRETAGTPSLLQHHDVVTFFHEFGHAMHELLGRTEMALDAGTSVKTDFVELPSQMFESWMWDPQMLQRVSRHYKTGEPLPLDSINALVKLQYFNAGLFYQRQTGLSMLALELFGPGERKDPQHVFERVWSKYLPHIVFDSGNHMPASFGHLTEYGAKYYGYLWSRVFAYDVFEHIKREGLLNPEAGKRFVACILGRGGSADPNDLLVEYLGREPRIDAFINAITSAAL